MGRTPLGEKAKFLEVRIKEAGNKADWIRDTLEEEMKTNKKHKTLSKAAAAVIIKYAKIIHANQSGNQ